MLMNIFAERMVKIGSMKEQRIIMITSPKIMSILSSSNLIQNIMSQHSLSDKYSMQGIVLEIFVAICMVPHRIRDRQRSYFWGFNARVYALAFCSL